MENSNLSSTPVVAQFGRPPDLVVAVPAINGSMVSAPVVITQAGFLDDNMDTDAETVNGHTKDACGVGNQNSMEGIDRRQHQPSVDDRFGPWLQVVNRRRHPSMLRKVVNQDISVATEGSRFNVLNVDDGDNHQSQQQLNAGDCEVFVIDKPVVEVSNSMERDTSVVIAAKDKPAMKVSNSMERDTSVAIAAKDKSYGPICSTTAKGVRRSSTVVKNLPRKEGRAKKNIELDGERTVVADWALSLSRSLSKEGELVSKSIVVPAEKSVEASNGGV
ncbi:hypothetical protein V6N12_031926 [Hibiscus sabdariffa]|uniref:Uncharacterized protein n=1 Tax=Hibiscus sabdariffa TaxID=183260 RepID=A0ABR2BZ41_9ROSI